MKQLNLQTTGVLESIKGFGVVCFKCPIKIEAGCKYKHETGIKFKIGHPFTTFFSLKCSSETPFTVKTFTTRAVL